MIRAYVAVVSSDLSLPQVTAGSYRKATIRLVHNENNHEFSIDVEGTDYSFKVVKNVRAVDKHNIANGFVRISFIMPNSDIFIACNPGDLKAFMHTVEVVKDIKVLPPLCSDSTHEGKLKCICEGPKFSQYERYHADYECVFSVLVEYLAEDISDYSVDDSSVLPTLCEFCCYHVLQYYNDKDACKILNTWKPQVFTGGSQMPIYLITANSYPYLKEIRARGNNLVDIPEAIGSLPCLTLLDLSDNHLGQATNWNWLTSPFIRENLRTLDLPRNGLSTIPESVGQLKNLKVLILNHNYLTDLPTALGNLKYLRKLHIAFNKMAIFPTWMYRQECFYCLSIEENELLLSTEYHRPQLSSNDFQTLAMPSLFQTVAKYIITNKLDFWEYNIPATLIDYLEGAYYCRCGSVVFRDTNGRVVQCWVKTEALAEHYDCDVVPVAICFCSYKCYKLIKPYVTL